MKIFIFVDETTQEIWYYAVADDELFPFAVDRDIIKYIKRNNEGDDEEEPVIH